METKKEQIKQFNKQFSVDIEFLTDFCKEIGENMKNKIVTGYDTNGYKNGVVRIWYDITEGGHGFFHTNVVNLISFLYNTKKAKNKKL